MLQVPKCLAQRFGPSLCMGSNTRHTRAHLVARPSYCLGHLLGWLDIRGGARRCNYLDWLCDRYSGWWCVHGCCSSCYNASVVAASVCSRDRRSRGRHTGRRPWDRSISPWSHHHVSWERVHAKLPSSCPSFHVSRFMLCVWVWEGWGGEAAIERWYDLSTNGAWRWAHSFLDGHTRF